MMKPVQEVFSKQSPELELMHMDYLNPRLKPFMQAWW
jgi:hypothetical protein